MTHDWTPAAARRWARRLRKVGFSPVALHRDHSDGPWYLRCNWPFDFASAPLDLLDVYVTVDYGGVPYLYGQEHEVCGDAAARILLERFRLVRLGMGSRPLPAPPPPPERPIAPATRLRWSDDWPRTGQRHPDYQPEPLAGQGAARRGRPVGEDPGTIDAPRREEQ